ncbi:MAG: hypothetical protein JF593_14950 [Novosphingobium sp.]|nr:hypothetical protein [Novosphingobium sp.]
MASAAEGRLPRWHVRLLVTSGLALWLSGGGWLLLHYFGQRQGEFGLERSPLEPWLMRLHGFALLALLLGLGGLFVAHIPRGWGNQGQRLPGLALSAMLALLVVSGYLLYYIGADDVRSATSIVHWAVGLALPLIFVWHAVKGLRSAARERSRLE